LQYSVDQSAGLMNQDAIPWDIIPPWDAIPRWDSISPCDAIPRWDVIPHWHSIPPWDTIRIGTLSCFGNVHGLLCAHL